jgi:hypothetical protein
MVGEGCGTSRRSSPIARPTRQIGRSARRSISPTVAEHTSSARAPVVAMNRTRATSRAGQTRSCQFGLEIQQAVAFDFPTEHLGQQLSPACEFLAADPVRMALLGLGRRLERPFGGQPDFGQLDEGDIRAGHGHRGVPIQASSRLYESISARAIGASTV